METLLYLGVIMLMAGFIQGFSGFGSVLLSLPLLAIFLDVKTAIPLVALMGVILTVFLLIPLWKDLEWPRIWPLLVGALPGVPIGIFFLKSLNSRLLLIFLGFVLVCYSLYSLLFKVASRDVNKGWAYFSGFLAGCFGGAFSAAGPPVIVYVSIQSWRKELIKSTLQGFFSHLRPDGHCWAGYYRTDNASGSQAFCILPRTSCPWDLYRTFLFWKDPGRGIPPGYPDSAVLPRRAHSLECPLRIYG